MKNLTEIELEELLETYEFYPCWTSLVACTVLFRYEHKDKTYALSLTHGRLNKDGFDKEEDPTVVVTSDENPCKLTKEQVEKFIRFGKEFETDYDIRSTRTTTMLAELEAIVTPQKVQPNKRKD